MTDARDFDLVVIRADGLAGLRHIAEPDGGAERMRIHAGAHEPDNGVAAPDGFVVIQQGLRRLELELHQALTHSGLPLLDERLAPDEAAGLVELDRKA